MAKRLNNPKPNANRINHPTAYRETFPALAKTFCMECGGTNIQLARLFRVGISALKSWLAKYPQFKAAVQAGKDFFDTGTAEQCLLKRVTGYNVVEITEEADKAGKLNITKKIYRHIPPDVTAQIFFLCNRNGERWRQRQTMEHTGANGMGIVVNLTLSKDAETPKQ